MTESNPTAYREAGPCHRRLAAYGLPLRHRDNRSRQTLHRGAGPAAPAWRFILEYDDGNSARPEPHR